MKAHRKTRTSLQDLDNEDLNYASRLGEVKVIMIWLKKIKPIKCPKFPRDISRQRSQWPSPSHSSTEGNCSDQHLKASRGWGGRVSTLPRQFLGGPEIILRELESPLKKPRSEGSQDSGSPWRRSRWCWGHHLGGKLKVDCASTVSNQMNTMWLDTDKASLY